VNEDRILRAATVSQESGVRRQETGIRHQESGDRVPS
jgi:hypothetical protein